MGSDNDAPPHGLERFGKLTAPSLAGVLLGVTYHIGARVGLLLTVSGTGISVFWISNAVTLATLLLVPRSWWPYLVIGSWTGDFAAEVTISPVADSLVFAAVNAAQTLACAALLRKAAINPIGQPRHYLLFLLSYVGVAAPIGATVVTEFMTYSHGTSGLWPDWMSWWLGDNLYVMTLTPLILTIFQPSDTPVAGSRNEALLLAMALLAASYFDFYLLFPTNNAANLILPPLLWAALRFGVTGAATATSVLTAIAGFTLLYLSGGLPSDRVTEQAFHLQVMLFGNASSAMILALVGEGWRRAERGRTAALEDAQNALKAAERANAAKSHFLAAASHDLRQPFQALRLFIDVLDQMLVEPAARKVIEAAKTALSGGESLLLALLDLSKFDAGAITVNRQTFPISDILHQLNTEYTKIASEKGIKFTTVNSSAFIESDSLLLSRLLRNLINNAVKYTDHGKILFGCRRIKGGVRIEVWDTGIGIPPEQQSRIFDEFFQVGNVGRDLSMGLGIGLSVVQRTAQHLGHQISMRSVPGRGSVFAVTIGAPTEPR